jgi:hypothetical protein
MVWNPRDFIRGYENLDLSWRIPEQKVVPIIFVESACFHFETSPLTSHTCPGTSIVRKYAFFRLQRAIAENKRNRKLPEVGDRTLPQGLALGLALFVHREICAPKELEDSRFQPWEPTTEVNAP